jgi:hypothetical protein
MSTFLQEPDNDLALRLNARGKKSLVLVKDEVVAGTIKLRNRLQLFLGEWFLDTRIGVPYYQVVLVKNPDLSLVRRMFTKVILSIPVLATVPSLVFSYDKRTRAAGFTFTAYASDGRKVTGGSGEPFIVAGRDVTNKGA